jgi:class 3 adenylate cyclase
LVDLLNYYLSTMSDIILEQKGTIDKYQGDAIVSFFGAPLELEDHAIRACTAGIIMRRMETDINKYIMEKGISPSPLLTRIGLNTGEMVVGNMGTQKKMNYTIISNAVNLASRLEGVNKQYGTWILASDSTIKETKGKLLTRRLDRVKVVGINEATLIHEILELKSDATDALFELVYLFHKALDIYENRRWKDAENAFEQVLKLYPNDGPSKLFAERCRQYHEYPPAVDWDGSVNITEK